MRWAVADEVWMLENSIYSVLSPEGFASILWKDSKRASEAAEVMKLTAQDLERLGIVEQVISEPAEFTDENLDVVCRDMDGRIGEFLEKYCAMDAAELTEKRYGEIPQDVRMEMKNIRIGEKITKIPLIQGGMGVGISLGRLAGAVAREGGIGIISSAQIGYREADFDRAPAEANLRAIESEMEKARSISPDGIIGFNVMTAAERACGSCESGSQGRGGHYHLRGRAAHGPACADSGKPHKDSRPLCQQTNPQMSF